jgi:hypothetical protein
MRSLRASTGLATVCVAGDDHDRIVWARAGADETVPGGTFAEGVNAACDDCIDTPWIFITGDDVRFYPGWLDEAQATAKATGAKVIGTNDLSDLPAARRGEHSPHLLISTDYIREVGASWDGPGIVCHEGYGHCFVDNEIVTAAKQRGVWAYAERSIVEHLHPAFGKAESDATYDLGDSKADTDERHWRSRYQRFATKVVAA